MCFDPDAGLWPSGSVDKVFLNVSIYCDSALPLAKSQRLLRS